MNIIFGREQAEQLKDKYVLLELDTVKLPSGQEITAFCAVEDIPIPQMPRIESMKSLHENLISNYYKKDWNFCLQALEHLMGFWNHDMDTFYTSIQSRIEEYQLIDPGSDWDGKIIKT